MSFFNSIKEGFSSGGSNLEGTMAKKIEGKWSIGNIYNYILNLTMF